MSPQEAQQELIDEFDMFDNWMDRYQYIIDLGRLLPDFPDEWKNDDTRLDGCQSNVWVHAERQGETLHFYAISDAAIVSGLIAILLRIYNDRTPREIIDTPADFLTALGLDKHLSPTRSNGLHAMLERIKSTAHAHA
ncbi:SufE family protein [Kushneria sp. TE3]|uniref:SufE family protein n=1 Tax=Kushneria sp. TE3 TaxID=3449832 RepID=UPI003F687002